MDNHATNNNDVIQVPGVVQSVDRALTIMEILSRDGWSGVTEIANELGINKSTVFRLIATLKRRGLVEQHPETQKYRLGFAVVRLAAGVRATADIIQIARPICERLSEQVGETVNIAVLEAGAVVNIDQVNASPSALTVDWFGQRSAPHATSTGKVLLANSPRSAVEEYLDGELEAFTPNTIADAAQLRETLAQVAAQGWAQAQDELEIGLSAVSAPIRTGSGSVAAALCVSGLTFRLHGERLEDARVRVIAAADEISLQLGHLGRPAGAGAGA